MTLSYWQEAARAPDVEADVAVVGGGLLGTAAAYWLKQLAPGKRVALIEAKRLGSGASGRSVGLLMPGIFYDYLAPDSDFDADWTRRRWQFVAENLRLLQSILDQKVCEFEQRGSITVLQKKAGEHVLQRAIGRMRSDGVPVAPLTPDQTNERLGAKGFGCGLYLPSGAVANPLKLTTHLAAESEARVFEHHPLQQIHAEGDHAVLEAPQRRVLAEHVILAVGPQLHALYPGLQQYVRAVRGQALATVPAEQRSMPTPAYVDEGAYYVRQLRDGRMLVGEAYDPRRTAERPADETTPAVQAKLERFLHQHFEWTRALAVSRRWSGIMTGSPDRVPVVGAVPDLDNSFWAGGFTGEGLGYGLHLGRLLAEVVLGRTDPDDLDLFSTQRFGAVPAA